MLTKAQRFHGHNSLRPVYNKGKSAYTRAIKLLMLESRSGGTAYQNSRVAVVVSKKVHKSAVVRNRIRRRVYTIMSGVLKKSEQPSDIILIINDASVATMPQQQLQHDVEGLLVGAKDSQNSKRG